MAIIVVLACVAAINWMHLNAVDHMVHGEPDARTKLQMGIIRLNLICSVASIPLLGAVFWLLVRHHKMRQDAESERDAFFQFSLDLFTIADTGWNFRQVNPACTRTLGWSAEELISRPIIGFVHPDDRNATVAEMEKLVSGEPTTNFENRYQCKDGSWKVLEWQAIPRPDGAIYAAARDVTEVRAGADALSVSDALRNAVLNSMLANIAVVDRDGTIIAINEGWKAFARENGGDASPACVGVGANYLDVCLRAIPDLGEEMAEVADGVRNVLAGRQPTYEYEYACDSPDEQRWFNMNISPLAREEGGAVITHMNRTGRKTAELALAESEMKFRLIADNNADVIWLGDPGMSKILYVNKAYERIWGHSCESLYRSPRSFMDPLHPLDRERVMQEKENNGKGGWETEYRIVRPDGTLRWVRDRGYPIRDEEDQIYRLTGVATDITHRKEVETAMVEKAAALEVALAEVREGKILLMRNDRLTSLGRMCAGLIHEINNPLNFAAQGVFLLKRNAGDVAEVRRADFLEILQDVEDGISRVVRLVSDLRGFTRVSSDATQTFELKPLVESALRFFSHEIKEAVKIRVDIPEAMRVRGDPNQITQVLANLMQNSLDGIRAKNYTNGESPKITFSGCSKERLGLLQIRDNGPGIEPEILEKIFDPFFTTKDVGSGMGLGLAISHRIMTDYGGDIDVHSVPGDFCEFSLTFPPA